MLTHAPLHRRDWLPLLVILAIAAFMRFGRADVVEYFHDDAMLSTLALEMSDGLRFPLTGILSSTGIPNSPVSVYILAAPFAISSDPQFVIHFVMLINVLGVGLLWLLARTTLGPRIALVTGLIYAVNPWAILFSRKIWAQDFHTPLILMGILLLLYGYCRRREPGRNENRTILAQVLGMPVMLIGLQIHFAAWALLPLLALILWIGRRQAAWRTAAMSLIVSVLVLLPYALGLAETLEKDPYRISDAIDRSVAGIGFSEDSIVDAMMLASGLGLETWLTPDQQDSLAAGYPALYRLTSLFVVLLALGMYSCYRRSKQLALIVAVWAFLPFVFLLVRWTPAYIHYFIPSIPPLTLLIAIGFDDLLRRMMRYKTIMVLAWLALALLISLLVMQWLAALDYVEKHKIDYPGFTIPLGKLNDLRERLRNADDVVVISHGMAWNLHHEVAVWDTLLWDDAGCVRTMVPYGYAVFPDHAFDVVIAPDAPLDPLNHLYAHGAPEHFAMREGERGYYVFHWDAAPGWTGAPIESIDPRRFANGVELTGFALDDGQVLLEWRLPGQRVGADFQYSVQLFDESGERLAQRDSRFWHGRHWCANDRLLTWGPLENQPNATNLKVAMYALGTGKEQGQFFNVNVLDEMGNPMGQFVDIPVTIAN